MDPLTSFLLLSGSAALVLGALIWFVIDRHVEHWLAFNERDMENAEEMFQPEPGMLDSQQRRLLMALVGVTSASLSRFRRYGAARSSGGAAVEVFFGRAAVAMTYLGVALLLCGVVLLIIEEEL